MKENKSLLVLLTLTLQLPDWQGWSHLSSPVPDSTLMRLLGIEAPEREPLLARTMGDFGTAVAVSLRLVSMTSSINFVFCLCFMISWTCPLWPPRASLLNQFIILHPATNIMPHNNIAQHSSPNLPRNLFPPLWASLPRNLCEIRAQYYLDSKLSSSSSLLADQISHTLRAIHCK